MTPPDGVQTHARDIERIRKEAMETAGYGLYRVTPDGTILFMDCLAAKVFDIEDRFPDLSVLVGKNISELFEYVGPQGYLREKLRQSGGHVRDLRYPFKTLKGEQRLMVIDAFFVEDEETREKAVQIITRDATAHARLEQALGAATERYRQLVETLHSGVQEIDTAGTILYANPAYHKMLGYSDGELIGQNIAVVLHERESDRVMSFIRTIAETQPAPTVYGNQNRTKDNRLIDVEVVWDYKRNLNGDVVGFVSVVTDITERKRTEEALRESGARYQNLFWDSPIALWELNASRLKAHVDRLRGSGISDFNVYLREHPQDLRDCMAMIEVVEVNRAALTLHGVERKEDFPRSINRLLIPETYQELGKALVAFAGGKITFEGEVPGQTLKGDRLVVALRLSVAPGYEDSWAKCFASLNDVTQRKEAEEALAFERRLINALLDTVPDAIYFKDTKSRFVRVNKAEADRDGLADPADVVGKTDFDLFFKDYAHEAFADEQEIMKTGRPIVGKEERETWADGRETWVSTTKAPLRDEAGNIIGTFGISRDITEQKRAEETLREYRKAVEASKDLIAVVDRNYVYILVNKAFLDFHNSAWDEVVGRTVADVLGKDLFEEEIKPHVDRCLNGEATQYEVAITHPKTGERFMHVSYYPLTDEYDQVTEVVAIITDITERKKSEAVVRESEARLRRVVESMPAMMDAFDEHMTIVAWNQECERVTGYTAQEMVGNPNALALLYPDEAYREQMMKEWRERGNNYHNWEWEIVCKDGSRRTIAWSNISERVPIPGWATWGIGVDVTERKELETALQESLSKAQAVLDASQDSIILTSPEGTIININESGAKRFGKPIHKLIGANSFDLAPPMVREGRKAASDEVARTGKPRQLEDERSGMTFSTTIYPVKDEYGKVVQIAVYAKDITEQRRAEARVRSLSAELMKAQETERQRISRDLHDHVAQDLSAVKMALDTLLDNEVKLPHDMHEQIGRLSVRLKESIKSMRDLAYDLRPAGIERYGLAQTLFQYCNDFSETNDIEVDFASAGMDGLKLDSDTNISLFRVVQEGLNNIRKHAGACCATVRLVASFPKIILRVEDDGKGFDVGKRLSATAGEKCMGLRSMEERVNLLKGTMQVKSEPRRGTRILIEIPHGDTRKDGTEKHTHRR